MCHCAMLRYGSTSSQCEKIAAEKSGHKKKPWLLAEEASHGMNVGYPQNLRRVSSSVNSRRARHVSPEVALLPPRKKGRKNPNSGEVGVTHSHERLINILSALRRFEILKTHFL